MTYVTHPDAQVSGLSPATAKRCTSIVLDSAVCLVPASTYGRSWQLARNSLGQARLVEELPDGRRVDLHDPLAGGNVGDPQCPAYLGVAVAVILQQGGVTEVPGQSADPD